MNKARKGELCGLYNESCIVLSTDLIPSIRPHHPFVHSKGIL